MVAKPVHSSVIVMPNAYVGFDVCLIVLHPFSFVKLSFVSLVLFKDYSY